MGSVNFYRMLSYAERQNATAYHISVGYFEGSKLLFAAKVHQGLNPANRRALLKLLQPLVTTKCPFANLPTSKSRHWGEGVTAEEMSDYVWLRPEIEAEVKFAEGTAGSVLRHAEFVALREA
jgi:bifunctional non-homologous end joining protein LigD